MTEQNFSDETLMAFADGELQSPVRESVQRAIDADNDIAARVAMFMESGTSAKKALAPLLEEPVPDALLERVTAMVDADASNRKTDTGQVIPFTSRIVPPAGFEAGRWIAPIAASVALMVGAVAGYVIGTSDGNTPTALQMAALDRADIAGALNTVPSGKDVVLADMGDRFRAIATYKDANGTICREFEVDHKDQSTVVAVACKPNTIWKVQFSVVAGQAGSGYAPASSLESLEAYLTATGAGEPLTPEAEAKLLEAKSAGVQ